MDERNGLLLRLFECIESIKSEVKQKMKHAKRWSRWTKVTISDHEKVFDDTSDDDDKKIAYW